MMRVCSRPYGKSLASRVSYTLFRGDIPDGLLVCHDCDNPRCVNPMHLFVGTQQDNMDDMKSKGRQRSPVGESSNLAKITAADVPVIRQRYGAGESRVAIAADYGITPEAIWLIATGRKWKHLPGACKSRGVGGKFKMTPEQTREARMYRSQGESYARIAARFGLSETAVYNALHGTPKRRPADAG